MMLLGDPLDAATALRWGLVTRVCAEASIAQDSADLAARLSTSADIAEGVRAFLEKRRPTYSDKIEQGR